MFYTYRQNNSGGSFKMDDSVDIYVIIEAPDGYSADRRAEDVGIYFNGCNTDRDCPCCGDRWYPVGRWATGTIVPEIDGNSDLTRLDHYIIYFLDGTIQRNKKTRRGKSLKKDLEN